MPSTVRRPSALDPAHAPARGQHRGRRRDRGRARRIAVLQRLDRRRAAPPRALPPPDDRARRDHDAAPRARPRHASAGDAAGSSRWPAPARAIARAPAGRRTSTPLLLYPESFAVLVLGRAYSAVKRALVPAFVDDERDLVAAQRAGCHASAPSPVSPAVSSPPASSSSPARQEFCSPPPSGTASRRSSPPDSTRPVDVHARGRPADRPRDRRARQRSAVRWSPWPRCVPRVGLVVFVLAFALEREGGPDPLLGVVALAIAVGSFAGTFVSPRLRDGDERAHDAATPAPWSAPSPRSLPPSPPTCAPSCWRRSCSPSHPVSAATRATACLQRAAGTGDRSRVFAALRHRAAARVGRGRARPDGRRRRCPARLRHRHVLCSRPVRSRSDGRASPCAARSS